MNTTYHDDVCVQKEMTAAERFCSLNALCSNE